MFFFSKSGENIWVFLNLNCDSGSNIDPIWNCVRGGNGGGGVLCLQVEIPPQNSLQNLSIFKKKISNGRKYG